MFAFVDEKDLIELKMRCCLGDGWLKVEGRIDDLRGEARKRGVMRRPAIFERKVVSCTGWEGVGRLRC